MSRLLAVIKILPEDDSVKLDDLKAGLKGALPKGEGNLYVHKFEEEEIAFGLKALKAFVIMPGDYAGGTQPVEDAFASVKGVGQVDVEVVQTLPG
ncbi:MAG: elongation factor 1-beta [Candidatus Methanomethylicia archaeon]|nr:elongation factor 1-beta [Candidatus Methanomethylicia archaeon]